MKIKLYLVTYKNDLALDKCLESLSKTNIPPGVRLQKFVINNHSNFTMRNTFGDVSVLHNSLRPDFSTGHLSRNWNQAIINGFENLDKPVCDIVVTCQVDTIFTPNWLAFLIDKHKNYSLITACPGDGFVSYTVESVKNIGLWDERFCSIEYQEADYFTRALIFNKDKSSINDFHHGRILNPILPGEADRSFVYRENTDYQTHTISTKYGDYNLNLFKAKYRDSASLSWSPEFISNPPKLLMKNFMYYPYFEMGVHNRDALYH